MSDSLADALSCVHFPIVDGLTPSIQELRDAVDNITRDWLDGNTDEGAAPPEELQETPTSKLQESPQVQAAIMRLWAQFQKDTENCIGQQEYEGFMLRVMRALLPGLGTERETKLASNAWEEDATGLEKLPFGLFLDAMIRLAKVWTNWRKPEEASAFLDDLLKRTTVVFVTLGETGEVIEKSSNVIATFYTDSSLDEASTSAETEFGTVINLSFEGSLPKFQVRTQFVEGSTMVTTGSNVCWFDETVVNPEDDVSPNDGIRREWIALDAVVPIGRTALVALTKAKAAAAAGPIEIDISQFLPSETYSSFDHVAATGYALRASLGLAQANPAVSVEVAGSISVEKSQAVSMIDGHTFGINDLLAATLRDQSSGVLVRPCLSSPLDKLRKLREELGLEQPNPAEAAIPGGAVTGDPNGPKLPSFASLLEGKAAVDPETGLVKAVKDESLLMSATLQSLAATFLYKGPDERLEKRTSVDKGVATGISSARNAKPPPQSDFTTQFQRRVEGFRNDATDFLGLAKTPPVTLWVFGQCDSLGEYKTEVCRRLAERLQLQWLKPQYLLEMAVKTPERFRSPLMARCVEQLQRGMVVPTADALRLALEFMASPQCKTNGYILDFPPIVPSDKQAITQFIEKVRQISASPEIRVKELLSDDVKFEPLTADPEPPKPAPDPDAEGADPAAEGEAAAEGDAEAEPAPTEADAVTPEAEAAGGAVEAAAGDGAEEEVVVPEVVLEDPVPNPWANVMPRRVVTLGMDSDELAGWRVALLQARHEARNALRKEREAAGEEVEDEGEEEAVVELPQLPEDEEELTELFARSENDVLLTMGAYVSTPSLKAPEPGSKPPPIPDSSFDVKFEDTDGGEFAKGEASIIKFVHGTRRVPMVSLHADGKDPETMVDILEVATGKFQGPRVALPQPVEGAADVGDLTELLTAGLDEKNASRRWSMWQQHCPVSLFDKRLTPGQKEFAVDYAGNILLFADEKCQRRFCTWPKTFLTPSPQINAPGMALGYSLLSPAGFRTQQLAERLRATYDFDLIDVPKLLVAAMQARAVNEPILEPVEGEEAIAPVDALPEGFPGLTVEEKKDLCTGQAISTATTLRLIGDALKVGKNIESFAERKRLLDEAKAALEAAADDEDKKAALGFEVDDSGEPIVKYPANLNYVKPSKGFVLIGFPETGEQLTALQDQLQINLERIIMLKRDAEVEDAPEVADFLTDKGFDEEMPLASVLEKYDENIATLEAIETAPVRDEIALHADLGVQLVMIRKKIDPFYSIIEDPSVGIAIPDPDEFNMEDAVAAAQALEEETGEKQDKPEAPVIPWGLCGPYCPVTLAEDHWLYPGAKELQTVFHNRVYTLASEAVRDKLLAEPTKYIPTREPVTPPPRILITGPSGSGADEQCKQLSEAYGIPTIELEDAWRRRVDEQLENVKRENRRKVAAEKLLEPMISDDIIAYPDGWALPVEKAEGEEEEEAAEEVPEEDGLEDEAREQLYVDAMRDVLGRHIGACIINAQFKWASFGQVDAEADPDPTRSLQNLLVKARRLPDLTLILKAKNDVAASNVYDFAEIDRAYEERLQAYLKLKQQAEEAEDEEVPIPEPPEDLVVDAEEGETESGRVKEKFIANKDRQQADLAEFVEAITAARATWQKVSADRGAAVAHKSIRFLCKPFMEQRSSLLVKHQARNLTPSKAMDVQQRALAQPSCFGDCSPLASNSPLFSGKPDTFSYGVEFRGRCFYPRSEDDRQSFLTRLQDFTQLPSPSPIAVHPCICINGPPLSGKTTLAKSLAKRTGAVYLSASEVLSALCHRLALPCGLSKRIEQTMRRGLAAETGAVVEALRQRIAAPDVAKSGWILDDFPVTREFAAALTEAGVVPHRVLTITIPEAVVFERAAKIGKASTGEEADLVQNEVSLQRQRLDAFASTVPLVNAYYSLRFSNVCELDGTKSFWATEDLALRETSQSISQRLEYYRRTSHGRASCIHGLGFSPERVRANESTWRTYCPVSLTLGNELVLCKDRHFAVEYNSKIYWLSSAENMRLFLEDPESFLQVPIPGTTPQLLPLVDRVPTPSCMLEEDGAAFCPVALVDRKELVKAVGCYIVQHQGKYWSMESKKSCEKFMRRPMRYVARAKLPAKKPALQGKDSSIALLTALTQRGQDSKGLQPAEMLTFMQASVAEIICQALVESGERRPLYPGRSAQESSLLFLASFLRAKNVLNTEMTSSEVKGQLDKFSSDVALPNALKELTKRKEEYENNGEGVWTSSDSRQFQELCNRFDTLLNLQA